jgi:hypothetical protein
MKPGKMVRMIRVIFWGGILGVGLMGCAAHEAKAPCPQYGQWCSKTPINTWTY